MKEYIAGIIDSKGIKWLYEGKIGGQPIWTMKSKSKPEILTKEDAYQIAEENFLPGDKIVVERA